MDYGRRGAVVKFINIADLTDPSDSQGRTYRQINRTKSHSIPVGSLVEYTETGVRLFVVMQGRDCDETPLYWLSPDKDDTEVERPGFRNQSWIGGYPECSLRVVQESQSCE
jgi:hypothetical protein